MFKKHRTVFLALLSLLLGGIPASAFDEGKIPAHVLPEAIAPSFQATHGAYIAHVEATLDLHRSTRQLLAAIQKYLPKAAKVETETIRTILHSLNNKYPENIEAPDQAAALEDEIIALDPSRIEYCPDCGWMSVADVLAERIDQVILHLEEELAVLEDGHNTLLPPPME